MPAFLYIYKLTIFINNITIKRINVEKDKLNLFIVNIYFRFAI